MMLVLKSLALCRTSNKCHSAGERLVYVQRTSADSDHNVFTTISYDTATNGTVTARAAMAGASEIRCESEHKCFAAHVK